MTFTDPHFILVFLPLTLLAFHLIGRFGRRPTLTLLAVASVIFYAEWSVRYVFLLLASVVMNFLFALAIDRSRNFPALHRLWLLVSITANLLLLCWFKYLFPLVGFLAGQHLLAHGWGSIVLPLGISFFTFTQIAYLIDLQQGAATLEGPVSYLLFVTFFPHLIAGPLIHHKEMMPQFAAEKRYRLDPADCALGFTWFCMGLFKKVMIADRIAPTADLFYAHPAHAGALQAWLGVLTYALQLYFDFSGYSDMALGLARMFSIRFPLNFNSPYKAADILGFWQRWHITLTRYIMDYLYAPIVMRVSARRLQKGKRSTRKSLATPDGFASLIVLPTLITLGLAGMWHGAGLKFLLYGLLHGVYIVINHAWHTLVPDEHRRKRLLPVPAAVLLTFVCVLVSQVFFRAHTLHDAFVTLAEMAGRSGLGLGWTRAQALPLAALFAAIWCLPNTQEVLGQTRPDDAPNWSLLPWLRWQLSLPWSLATGLAFSLSLFFSTANSTFVYYQF